MTLKKCPCCQKMQTTKNAQLKGRDEVAIYFNCKDCHSTFIIRYKDWEKRIVNDLFNVMKRSVL